MANYCCTIRTNYFTVKDNEKFEEFMSHVRGTEDSVALWKEERDGKTMYGFGSYGTIFGYCPEPDDEDADFDGAYEAFEAGLVEHVADGDAILIFEAGNEKMRYVTGYATVITGGGVDGIDLKCAAMEIARHMLGNPEFNTKCEY